MGITEFLVQHITHFIDSLGYVSVCVLMAMESMVLPVPSEAVMPFAGFLIAEKSFTFVGVIFYSTTRLPAQVYGIHFLQLLGFI